MNEAMFTPDVGEWIATRPPEIQELLNRYLGDVFDVDGAAAHVIGATEMEEGPPWLLLSFIDPRRDYEGAVRDSFNICPPCAEEGA